MFSRTYRSIGVLLLFITVNHWVLGSLHLIASVFVTSSLYAAVPLSLPLTVEQFQWPNRLQMQMIHKYASEETNYGWKMYQLISTKGKVRSARFLYALGPCSALRSQ